MGIAIYRVSDLGRARRRRRDLQTGLAEAASLVDQFSQQAVQRFLVKGRLIADLPKLKAAAATDHPPTVQPIAEEMQDRIDADLLVVIGSDDRVLARAGRLRLDDDALLGILAPAAQPGTARRSGRSSAASCTWPRCPIEPVRMLVVGLSLDRDVALSHQAADQQRRRVRQRVRGRGLVARRERRSRAGVGGGPA